MKPTPLPALRGVTTAILPALALLLTALSGCDRGGDAAGDPHAGHDHPHKLRVVCTTTMIADLARQIAGEHATVEGIMKPGEDPHVYDVRPRDAQLVKAADLVLMNGLHLESTLEHVIENAQAADRIVRLAQDPNIKPLGSETIAGAPDPHCWFNVRFFKVYAERARDALSKADPEHASQYAERTAAYLKQLDELDQYARAQLATVPRGQRAMVTSHDAFQYFGHEYEVDVFAVIGISTEQQPRPQDIARLEALVRERNVKALFIETSVSQTLNDIVRKVAAASGAKIGGTLYSDSLGAPDSPDGAGTYIGMVRHNVDTIVHALR